MPARVFLWICFFCTRSNCTRLLLIAVVQVWINSDSWPARTIPIISMKLSVLGYEVYLRMDMSLQCWILGTNQRMPLLLCHIRRDLNLGCRYLTRVWTIYVTSTKLVAAQPCYCLMLLWTSGAVQSRRAWDRGQVHLALWVKEVIYACVGAKLRCCQKQPHASWCWKGTSLRTQRWRGCQERHQVNCGVQSCQPYHHEANDWVDGERVWPTCISTYVIQLQHDFITSQHGLCLSK